MASSLREPPTSPPPLLAVRLWHRPLHSLRMAVVPPPSPPHAHNTTTTNPTLNSFVARVGPTLSVDRSGGVMSDEAQIHGEELISWLVSGFPILHVSCRRPMAHQVMPRRGSDVAATRVEKWHGARGRQPRCPEWRGEVHSRSYRLKNIGSLIEDLPPSRTETNDKKCWTHFPRPK